MQWLVGHFSYAMCSQGCGISFDSNYLYLELHKAIYDFKLGSLEF